MVVVDIEEGYTTIEIRLMNYPAASCEVSQLKKVFRHSALDAESRLFFFWIPAFAGMTECTECFLPRSRASRNSLVNQVLC